MTFMAGHQALLMRNNFIDPFAANVRTLLHFDGSLTNTGLGGDTFAFNGGGVITTTPADVLTGSGSLDCTAGTSANAAGGGNGANLGTGDFCVECFFYDPGSGAKNQFVWLLQSVSTTQTVRLYGSGAATITADVSGGGPSAPEVAYSLGTWVHAAISRSGSNWTLWINGAVAKTWTNSTFDGGASTTNWWIGSGSGGGTGRMCRIDEFRVTVGTPRYTIAFTPSYPFPNP
jgi:Concanavalin A-like lectin/glucanases superfamily